MNYFSLNDAGSYEIVIEKSRFICYFSPAHSPETAQQFITTIKLQHHQAAHNCSAYIVGEHQKFQKANDDGEPSGTAGIPMLEVLKKRQLSNIVVVVTRYFGGIKLGAGGLVRAYGGSVVAALDHAAVVVQKVPYQKIQCMIDFDIAFKVEHALRNDSRFIVEQVDYLSSAVIFFLLLPAEDLPQLQHFLDALTGQSLDLYEIGTVFHEKTLDSD